jgi:hypothetical protein
MGVRAADPGGNPALHPDGPSIRNGTVAGFAQVGIYVPGRFAAIENMRVVNSGAAISAGASARISRNTVANNQFGVACSAGCLVEQNMISGSSSASGKGIELFSGTVLGNVAAANGGAGVRCFAFGTGCGYGDNVLVGKNNGGAQVRGPDRPAAPERVRPSLSLSGAKGRAISPAIRLAHALSSLLLLAAPAIVHARPIPSLPFAGTS